MNTWREILASRIDRPELLGTELEPFPFISGFGIAFRVSRLCCLEPKDLFSVLGIRAAADLNLLQACHRPGASRTRFEERIGLKGTQAPKYWSTSAWSPLDLHNHWIREDLPLRHCPRCARYGYHCSLFQLPSIEMCPWHGCPLTSHCQQCERPYSVGTTGELDVGRCACGLDLFDSTDAATLMWRFPHEQALEVLERYLAWASSERIHRHFVPPHDEMLARLGFAELACPPMTWNKAAIDRNSELVSYTAPASRKPRPGAFWGWALLTTDTPLTMARLSASTHGRLSDLSKSRLEQDQLDGHRGVPIEKFIPPLDVTSGADRWLRLSAVDPRALHTCAQLTDAVCKYVGDTDELDLCRSPNVQRSNTLDRIADRALLDRALEDILVKGYEQGLDALCRTHLAQPSQMRRWAAPVAEIVGRLGCLQQVRIAWIPAEPLVAERMAEMTTSRRVRATKGQHTLGRRPASRRAKGPEKVKRQT